MKSHVNLCSSVYIFTGNTLAVTGLRIAIDYAADCLGLGVNFLL